MSVKKHKNSLKNLSEIDPEFAEFLKKEDGSLLQFDASDEEDSESDSGDDYESNQEEKDETIKLEIASDDEDYEIDQENVGGGSKRKVKKQIGRTPVNLKMVSNWTKQLQSNSHEALSELLQAFRAAVNLNCLAGKNTDTKETYSKYIVKGLTVYNAVVSTSMVEVILFLQREITVETKKNTSNINKTILPTASHQWKKMKYLVKPYLLDIKRLLDQSMSGGGDILLSLMKHLYQLIPYYLCFPKLIKPLIKKLIELWSSESDTVRVLALRCMVQMLPHFKDKVVEYTFSNLYLACIKNCRFTSVTNLPSINYMKQSLVEMYCIKPHFAYRCAFVYIQQMAKYLHNALKLQKKETLQSINNWQFCHSLSIWTLLLGQKNNDEYLKSLIHPLVEIIMGTIRLNLSISYVPLRYFCVKILITLLESTGVYIPLIPIILEPLDSPLLNKQPKQTAMKSCVFNCILRMNKHSIHEKAFLDAVVEELFELLLHYSSIYSNSIGFPELMLPAIMQLKKYLKRSHAVNYVKKIKQLLEKLESRKDVVSKKRRQNAIDLKDATSIKTFEDKIKMDGNELKKYYDSWIKLRIKQLEMNASKKDEICKDDIPKIIRPFPSKSKATEEDRKEFKMLFDSASDPDDFDASSLSDNEERFKLKEERIKKDLDTRKKDKKKNTKSTELSDSEDFDEDELAILSRSPLHSEDEIDKDDDSMEISDNDDNVIDQQKDILENFNIDSFIKK